MSRLEAGELVWSGKDYTIVKLNNDSYQLRDIHVSKSYGTYYEFETAVTEANSMETNNEQ